MVRICAWCKVEMGKTPEGEPGETHGICAVCTSKDPAHFIGFTRPELFDLLNQLLDGGLWDRAVSVLVSWSEAKIGRQIAHG